MEEKEGIYKQRQLWRQCYPMQLAASRKQPVTWQYSHYYSATGGQPAAGLLAKPEKPWKRLASAAAVAGNRQCSQLREENW